MIRVHVIEVCVPQHQNERGDVHHSRLRLREDMSLQPNRVDSLRAITPKFREHFKLPADSRTVIRYDDSNEFGYRLFVVSDSRDSIERMVTRAYGRRDDYLPGTPNYLPDDEDL